MIFIIIKITKISNLAYILANSLFFFKSLASNFKFIQFTINVYQFRYSNT